MAPMQWGDATVSGGTLAARQEPDVSQPIDQFGQAGYAGPSYQGQSYQGQSYERQGYEGEGYPGQDYGGQVGLVEQFGPATDLPALPVGLDLPCTEDPELFFAESPDDVEQAKAMCRGCRARLACLAGALERREPWGVWGGELLIRGTIVPRKRPRGRPRKAEQAGQPEKTEVAA
jgi:WhiB family redox-sensing transcriptional regulator